MACIIVGGGIAGFTAAATCRSMRPEEPVTILDAERETGYFRALLPQFMAGSLPEEKLFFKKPDDPLLRIRQGVRVKSLDREKREMVISTGETLSYDRLILAHGGEPYLPGILAGPPAKGIFPVRDLSSARAARAWLSDHRRVLVFGGSLVAVKTAVHLAVAGFDVTVVVRRGHVLLRALSAQAASLVEKHLGGLGIKIVVNSPLEDIRIKEGAIASLKAGGGWLDCDTLLVAAGTVVDTTFLEGTGLTKDGQLMVNEALQTADPRIFAAGDAAVVCTADGPTSPNTWPQAVTQGRTAARNLYLEPPLPHRDLSRINAMELHGLDMIILGPPVEGADVLSYEKTEPLLRRELFLKNGRLIGGSLIGDVSGAGRLRALITSGEGFTARHESLVRPARSTSFIISAPWNSRRAIFMS